jgi:EpsI family protein
LLLNGILALTLFGSYWGRRVESATYTRGDFLKELALPFRGWKTRDVPFRPEDLKVLQPDSTLLREYRSPRGELVELAVIAGHRKRSVHTPGFCMLSSGFEQVAQQEITMPVAGRRVPAVRSVWVDSRTKLPIVVTYFFTDGQLVTGSLVHFQYAQLMERFKSRIPLGALVRVIVPITSSQAAAEQLTDEFADAVLPGVLEGMRGVHIDIP